MSRHPETNPHFIKTPLQQREGQPSETPPSPGGPSSGRQDQQYPPPEGPLVPRPRSKRQASKKNGAPGVKPEHEGQGRSSWIPPAQQHPGQHPESHFPLHGNQVQSPPTQPPQHQDHPPLPFRSPWAELPPQHQDNPRLPFRSPWAELPPQHQPSTWGPSSGRQDQQYPPPEGPLVPRPRSKRQASKKKGAPGVKPEHEGQDRSSWIPPAQQHPGQHPESHFPLHGNQVQSPPTQPPQYQDHPPFLLHNGTFQSPWAELPPQLRDPHPQPHGPKHDSEPHVPPRNQDQDRGTGVTLPQHQERNPRQPSGLVGRPAQFSGLPKPGGTKPLIWLGAVFCAILWIVIFLGGLIVLIVYLVYRPRSPRFDVSSASLNMAYIDAGSLLNADLTVLANFTNPNKKVSVDFSYMIIDLYYGSTLIATQYIEPFSAERAESRFVNVHMVTSQVRLPVLESTRLQEQISKNGAIFDVKGVFRVRSKLGTLLKYSYRLYGHCTILVTAPPSGVLRATKCRTKR
ncbi:hypothetical protein NC653_024627 [Populus alba x Populus x berolinensis]|uniref:Late embryogenesis abundant protein LEA-2 subgroup domain-containing protein n=1 Tax=Populus alba x Populus x berolinensis TaxID=444605 RepID=A0AAD6M9B2_9ROSI|nr:hypothetical protein NC653_024627 [Populus alba x Populus x berolinensis]